MIEFCPFRRTCRERHYDRCAVILPTASLGSVRRAEAADTSQLYLSHRGTRLAGIGDGGEPIATMSVTKLIVGVIIGRVVRLGLLDLDQPVSTWIPEWRDGLKSIITVRQVMGHVSGLAADTWPQPAAAWPTDLVAHAVNDLPLAVEPETVQAYNNVAVSVLPAIVGRAAGRPFLDFAAAERFRPLGIGDWTWLCDQAGNPYAMASAAFTAVDWRASVSCCCGTAGGVMINYCRRTGSPRSAGPRSRVPSSGCC